MNYLEEHGLSVEDAKAKQDRLLGSQRGFKGNFTRCANIARDVLAMARNAPATPTIVDSLLAQRRNCDAAAKKVIDVYTELIDLTEAVDGVTPALNKLEKDLVTSQDALAAIHNPLTLLIATCEDVLRPRTPPPRQGNAHAYKPNEALRPKALLRTSTPVEMRAWIERFHAFYAASRLDRAPLAEQQAYFKAGLEDQLAFRLSPSITALTPVLDVPGNVDASCEELLKDEFRLAHPLFTRRLEYFRSKQQRGQMASDWVQLLTRAGDEADLAAMTTGELYVIRVMTGLHDEKLLEQLLLIRDPTKQSIDECIAQHETGQIYLRSIQSERSATAAAAAAANAPPPARGGFASRGRGQRGGGRGGGVPRPDERSPALRAHHEMLKQQGKCIRCALPVPAPFFLHLRDCRGTGKTCTSCNRFGHIPAACPGAAAGRGRGGPAGGGPPRARQADTQPQQQQQRPGPSHGYSEVSDDDSYYTVDTSATSRAALAGDRF